MILGTEEIELRMLGLWLLVELRVAELNIIL